MRSENCGPTAAARQRVRSLLDFALPHRLLLVRREWHGVDPGLAFEIRDGETPKRIAQGLDGAKSGNDPITRFDEIAVLTIDILESSA